MFLRFTPLLILGASLALTACGASREVPTRLNDAYEEQNRVAHAFNKDLDRVILRPTSNAYGEIVPEPARKGISNVAHNLGTPADVVNNVLQLRLGQAMHNTLRFAVNSTIGIAGLFDVATPLGLEERETDFGETLFYWGAPEGEYVEMPIAGPATTRHTVGRFVDLALDPLGFVAAKPSERWVARGFKGADVFGGRYRNSDLIDSILYDSADSYAQARLLYLENRRFKLRQGAGLEAEYLDPYADPYSDPYGDDPYAMD